MAWWSRKPGASPADAVDAADDAWARHVTALAAQGVAEPGSALGRAKLEGSGASIHDFAAGSKGTLSLVVPQGQTGIAWFALGAIVGNSTTVARGAGVGDCRMAGAVQAAEGFAAGGGY